MGVLYVRVCACEVHVCNGVPAALRMCARAPASQLSQICPRRWSMAVCALLTCAASSCASQLALVQTSAPQTAQHRDALAACTCANPPPLCRKTSLPAPVGCPLLCKLSSHSGRIRPCSPSPAVVPLCRQPFTRAFSPRTLPCKHAARAGSVALWRLMIDLPSTSYPRLSS